ncbi:MAG: hypothetical protein ABSF54_28600, partial [Bryobacteraceae bacterium]
KQETAIEFEESLSSANQVLDSYRQESIGKHHDGRGRVVDAVRDTLARRGAIEQPVGIELPLPVKDGLARNENIHFFQLI